MDLPEGPHSSIDPNGLGIPNLDPYTCRVCRQNSRVCELEWKKKKKKTYLVPLSSN